MNYIFVEKTTFLSVDTKILPISNFFFQPLSVDSTNFGHLSIDGKPLHSSQDDGDLLPVINCWNLVDYIDLDVQLVPFLNRGRLLIQIGA